MKVVVFAGTKGGSGRSTLCWNVAIEAVRNNRSAYLADRDPQKTIDELWKKREAMGLLDEESPNPLLLENVDTISGVRRRLIEGDSAREFLFVDLPGSFMAIIREAVAVADCVVLPVQPSRKDMLAQEAIARVIDEMGKTGQTILVLNRVDGRDSMGEKMAKQLNPQIQIKQRVAYKKADEAGKAAIEIDADAAKEIAGLWTQIQRVMRSSDDQAARREQPAKVVARRAR